MLIIPTTEQKTQVFLGPCKYILWKSFTSFLHTAWHSRALAHGYSPWDSASRTISPNTDYPDCPWKWPLKRPHQALSTALGRGKTYGTLNNKENWFIAWRPLNHQTSLAPQGRRDTAIPYPASRTPGLACPSWRFPTASTQLLHSDRNADQPSKGLGTMEKEMGKDSPGWLRYTAMCHLPGMIRAGECRRKRQNGRSKVIFSIVGC